MLLKTTLIFVLSFLAVFRSPPLVKVKVDDNITVDLPEDFERLSQAEVNLKYISSKPPLAVYSDRSRQVDFSVNVAFSRWNPEDLEIMRGFYKSSIMGLYDEVRFIKESVEEIDGRKYVVFEFVSTIKSDEDAILNTSEYQQIYLYSIHHCQLQNDTFPFQLSLYLTKDEWSGIAGNIMQSVKVKNEI